MQRQDNSGNIAEKVSERQKRSTYLELLTENKVNKSTGREGKSDVVLIDYNPEINIFTKKLIVCKWGRNNHCLEIIVFSLEKRVSFQNGIITYCFDIIIQLCLLFKGKWNVIILIQYKYFGSWKEKIIFTITQRKKHF